MELIKIYIIFECRTSSDWRIGTACLTVNIVLKVERVSLMALRSSTTSASVAVLTNALAHSANFSDDGQMCFDDDDTSRTKDSCVLTTTTLLGRRTAVF